MSKKFKQFWKSFNMEFPYIDVENMNSAINNIRFQMLDAEDFATWRNLYHQKEALEIQSDMIRAGMNKSQSFEKASRLSQVELTKVNDFIIRMQSKGEVSSKIISALQKTMPKLQERWKAERAYWTAVKKADTQMVGGAGDDLGIEHYKSVLSPHACEDCQKKTNGGKKIFKSEDIQKGGYGHVPPFHPNCFCILIPTV